MEKTLQGWINAAAIDRFSTKPATACEADGRATLRHEERDNAQLAAGSGSLLPLTMRSLA